MHGNADSTTLSSTAPSASPTAQATPSRMALDKSTASSLPARKARHMAALNWLVHNDRSSAPPSTPPPR